MKGPRRNLVGGAVALLALVLVLAGWPVPASQRAGWLEDHDALLRFTGESYANLGDRVRALGIRPRELDRRTRAALASARSLEEARRVEEAFVAAFRDPHFRIERHPGVWRSLAGAKASPGEASIRASVRPGAACAQMGFADLDQGRVGWTRLPGWRTLGGGTPDAPLLAGIVAQGTARTVGVLRIPIFSAMGFPALCEERWRERQARDRDPCDGACQDRIRRDAERDLVRRAAEQAEALRREGAMVLLVDVTGNGGGSGISDPMARQLTSVPLRSPAMGFVRHPHWEAQFARSAERFEEELRRDGLPAAQREILVEARDRSEEMRERASRRCDLSGYWARDDGTLPCEPTARFEGYVRHARPGELDGLETRGRLFGASQHPYREGAWEGPLLVLVDRRTASSAELFASMLRDNGAARILGERTIGAGCGYTNGGLRLSLPHLGATVRVPDCIRYRADGSNEAEGIAPDVPVEWADGDDPIERARKVLAAAGR